MDGHAGDQQGAVAGITKWSSVGARARQGSADEECDDGSAPHPLLLPDDDTHVHSGTCCGRKAWLYPEMPWGAPPECDAAHMPGVSPSPPRVSAPVDETPSRARWHKEGPQVVGPQATELPGKDEARRLHMSRVCSANRAGARWHGGCRRAVAVLPCCSLQTTRGACLFLVLGLRVWCACRVEACKGECH